MPIVDHKTQIRYRYTCEYAAIVKELAPSDDLQVADSYSETVYPQEQNIRVVPNERSIENVQVGDTVPYILTKQYQCVREEVPVQKEVTNLAIASFILMGILLLGYIMKKLVECCGCCEKRDTHDDEHAHE